MRKASIHSAAYEIAGCIARIWRAKTHRGMDPDAAEAMFVDVTFCLKRFERKLRMRMFRELWRPNNN